MRAHPRHTRSDVGLWLCSWKMLITSQSKDVSPNYRLSRLRPSQESHRKNRIRLRCATSCSPLALEREVGGALACITTSPTRSRLETGDSCNRERLQGRARKNQKLRFGRKEAIKNRTGRRRALLQSLSLGISGVARLFPTPGESPR